MDNSNSFEVKRIGEKIVKFIHQSNDDVERYCWIIIHEEIHGFKPSEYDIREVDETLYLAVLDFVKSKVQKDK